MELTLRLRVHKLGKDSAIDSASHGGRSREVLMSKSPTESALGKDPEDRPSSAIDRLSSLTSGAAIGAVAIAETAPAQAAEAISWDREVDVVVIGAGAGGLVSAIAAREKGASVLIVEKNFDIGGRAMMSFGGLYIGWGNPGQKGEGGGGRAHWAFPHR